MKGTIVRRLWKKDLTPEGLDKYFNELSDIAVGIAFVWKRQNVIYRDEDRDKVTLKDLDNFEDRVREEIRKRNLPTFSNISEVNDYFCSLKNDLDETIVD